jgi:hypothetical protein
MAAPHPNDLKATLSERCYQILATQRRKRSHALTVTRCTPTKSRLSEASP